MLNVFSLAQAVNESAGGYTSIDAYDFHGDVFESISEGSYIIANEAAEISDFVMMSEEIMVEAALNNPGALGIISESVIDTAIAKIKAFFEKLIKIVKGIIAKIKAFFFKFTGNTNKWLSATEEKIKKNANASGVGDLTYNCYKWDTDYVTSGIANGTKACKLEVIEEVDKAVNSVNDTVKHETSKYADDSYEDDKKDAASKAHLTNCETNYKISVTDLKDVPNAIAKKARGDGDKVDRKLSEIGILTSLNIVKKSGDTLKNIKSIYEELDKTYTKGKNAFESAKKKIEDDKEYKSAKDDDEAAIKAKSDKGAILSKIISVRTYNISIRQDTANTVQNVNMNLLKEMIKEFMGALNKVAFYKEKKEK